MAVDFPTNLIANVAATAPSTTQDVRSSSAVKRIDATERPRASEHAELTGAKKFEAMVMAQMMTELLPSDSTYFGDGFSGDVWKSMMAEQMANLMVKSTDFGIASLLSENASVISQPPEISSVSIDDIMSTERPSELTSPAVDEIMRTLIKRNQ